MGVILDDIDARPGSTTSLLRTIIGRYLRRLDGWISVAALVQLMADLDVPDARTRTTIVRIKQKGLLLPERRGAVGYRVNPLARTMLEHGDRRIFTVRSMATGDRWCAISFSLPESRRDVRHQLRRRLQWIGCGVVSPALWICPDYLAPEVEEIFVDLGIRSHATLFRTEDPQVEGDLADAVRTWWDLDALRAQHLTFQEEVEPLRARGALEGPADAFARYVRLLDSWRILPYNDPGLPAELLPADWPGQRSIELFTELSARFADGAWEHVLAVTGSAARVE